MTTVSNMISTIDAFVAGQNAGRSGVTPLDYDALTGAVPVGGNSVTGISGIPAGAPAITLPSSGIGNTVIVDGGLSSTASSSGTDSYSLFAPSTGAITLTDNNTGNSVAISNAAEIVFNLAATTSTGAFKSSFIVATGDAAVVASIYGAGLTREPDFQGLDFYISRLGSSVEQDLHAVAGYVLSSPEEIGLYPSVKVAPDHGGPADQAFVFDMYSGILHRTPTATEVAFYDQALAGTLVVNGQTLPAVDRATVLEYFADSPENQSNIAATKGGWLINPANGPMNIGALSVQAARSVLATDVSSGTVNAADFATLPSSSTAANGNITDAVDAGGVGIYGPNATSFGHNTTIDTIYVTSAAPANLTVNLDTQYFSASMQGQNVTVNGVSAGGTLVLLPKHDAGGTVNFSNSGNWVVFSTDSTAGQVTLPTIITGWNSTDVIANGIKNKVGTSITYGFASSGVLAGHTGIIINASPSAPINLAAYEQSPTSVVISNPIAINVGKLADDTIGTALSTINSEFHVLGIQGEQALFYGQDAHGDTMIFAWNPAAPSAGPVQASDITGVIKLVGVSAASLTAANFHN